MSFLPECVEYQQGDRIILVRDVPEGSPGEGPHPAPPTPGASVGMTGRVHGYTPGSREKLWVFLDVDGGYARCFHPWDVRKVPTP